MCCKIYCKRKILKSCKGLKSEPTVSQKKLFPIFPFIKTQCPLVMRARSIPALGHLSCCKSSLDSWTRRVLDHIYTRTANCHPPLASVSILFKSLVLFAVPHSCPDCKDSLRRTEETLRVANRPTAASHTAPG